MDNRTVKVGRRLADVLLAMSLGILSFTAHAQSWPSKPLRVIVPFAAGSATDTVARIYTQKMGELLGQTLVVDNRAGANGSIGADMVAKASPDGYTLLMGANTMLMASQLYKNVPFDPVNDFSSVSMGAFGTLMLVANPKTGIKSLQEFIAIAKAKPGDVTFGSPGIGTPHHMAMELLKSKTQLTMLHVPYKGTAGYVADLLGGELMVGFLPIHVAQGFVSSGKLVPLAVGGPTRNAVAPNVATFQELGVKDVNVDMWYAFFAPNRTPAPVINRLNTEIAAIMKLPDVRAVLAKAGLDAASSTTTELTTTVKQDYVRWGAVIKRNAITAD